MLFDVFNNPIEQGAFDKLYYYYKITNTLLDESIELVKGDKSFVFCRSKELRKKVIIFKKIA